MLGAMGYGSQLLQGLRDEMPDASGILAEVEHPADGIDPAERETRQRRINFYSRNGFSHSRVNGVIFGSSDYDYLAICRSIRIHDLSHTRVPD